MNIAIEILQKYWGFTSFRNPQEIIINSVLAQQDTVALLPTGGGKSICFQVPALAKEGICVVISPLIALMQDQVANLKERGIKAATIPSGSSQDDIIALFDNLKFGNYKFLYLSPERLQSTFIQQKISQLNVNLIAVDEAHCISEWGHDFRPSYRKIKILKTLHPQTPIIALTASATQKVIDDIVKNLALENPKIVKKSFFRKNLAYQIFNIEDKLERLKKIVTKNKSPIIIYINSRKKTEEIATFLNANGFKSSFYHGGLASDEKHLAFNNWMQEKTPIMVATNAFGMGIDKPNVRVVVHLNLPNSIENYLQEAGRAGRDGKKSFSVVLQNNHDISLFKERLQKETPTLSEIKEVYKKLMQFFVISYGELIETPFNFPFLDFCKKYHFEVNKVENILKILNNNGVLELSHHFNKKSTVHFISTSKQVLSYGYNNKDIKHFITILLRNYGGLFEQETSINEFLLAKKAGITSKQVIHHLQRLEQEQLITYKKANTHPEITFLVPREDDKTINKIAKDVITLIKQKEKKAIDLIRFIKNDKVCRSLQILQYFDEEKTEDCGICDVCIAKKRKKTSTISIKIIQLLKEHSFLTSKEISYQITATEKDVLIHLRNLLAANKIAINNKNQFYIPKN